MPINTWLLYPSAQEADRLRALIFHNPGFEPDIAALLAAAPTGTTVRTYSTEDIGRHFVRLFPEEVLGLDLSLYSAERYTRARAAWHERARQIVADLYGSFAFDIAVAPADDTPYWRDIGLAVEELGAPFVVLFKEATHPPGQLRVIAPVVRRYVPPTARDYLVNSQRTAEYAVACGADPAKVHVIGQPRFDAYATAGSDERPRGAARTYLFLTYEADAYRSFEFRAERFDALRRYLATAPAELPPTWPAPVDETWLPLRCQTEASLITAASREQASIVVKPHRQMDAADLAFDRRFVESRAREAGVALRYAQGTEELLPLLRSADVVIGFQTTVLLEAMALDKQVVYAAWGSGLDEMGDQLIPFSAWGSAIDVARSPEGVSAALARATQDPDTIARRRALAEEWLGPLDGHASERAWEAFTRIRDARAISAVEAARARTAVAHARAARRADMAAASVREAIWTTLSRIARLLTFVPPLRRGASWAASHARAARDRRLERQGRPAATALAGPFDAPLAVEIADGMRLAARKLRATFR